MPSNQQLVLKMIPAFALALLALAGGEAVAADGALDEARQAGRDAASFPPADEDYFRAMDNGVPLTAGRGQGPQHVAGLDRRQRPVLGPADPRHLRRVRPAEDDLLAPGAEEPPRQPLELPGPDQRALLRRRRPAPTPSASACGSTGAAPTARPTRSRTPRSTRASRSARAARTCRSAPTTASPRACSGLRLFPNPAFDEAAARKWDPERYYTDPDYYNSKDLVRPYRVGMSCAFCHVGPSPIAPPDDPENPKMGEHQRDGGLPVLLDRPDLRLGGRTRRTTCTSWSTPSGRARSTPRWCRPTTSTTRAR